MKRGFRDWKPLFLSLGLSVTQREEFGFEFFAEITLDDDFAVLGRAAAAAECLQRAGQRIHIGLWPLESAYHGHGLAASAVLFHPEAKFLLLGRQKFLLRLIIGLIVEIRIGGVHYSQPVLPIIIFLSHNEDKFSNFVTHFRGLI